MILLLLACSEPEVPGRIPVDAPESGYSASIWVQGNSSFAPGVLVCHEDNCAETGQDGFAYLFGLRGGELSVTVDNDEGDELLIPLNLNTNFVARWAFRSFSDWVLPDWLGALQDGTGVVKVFPGNVMEDTVTLAGVTLTSTAGEVWAVHDFEPAVLENQSKSETYFFLYDLPPGEIEITATHPEGACFPKSMGWPGSDAESILVPIEAGRVTTVNLECLAF